MARVLVAIVLLIVAAGCGGDELRQGSATTTTAGPDPAGRPGKLIEIGAGRSLFVHCVGSGTPTVVLESGFGADGSQWQAVQPELGRGTQVCAYDRVGAGNSVAPPGVQDAREEVADLRAWLTRERIDPPYVLAGHSYGGVLARVFAHLHPKETAGLVLIDTIGRDGRRRTLADWPRSQAARLREYVASTRIGDVDLAVGEAIARDIKTLGDMPLAVMDAGSLRTLPQRLARLRRAQKRLWARMHVELARLSDNSVHVTALRSDTTLPPHVTISHPLSSARCRRSCTPPATAAAFRRAHESSAAKTSAATARHVNAAPTKCVRSRPELGSASTEARPKDACVPTYSGVT